jgi:hypothetical protein
LTLRLLTFLELMQQFNVWQLLRALDMMHEAERYSACFPDHRLDEPLPNEWLENYRQQVSYIDHILEVINLEQSRVRCHLFQIELRRIGIAAIGWRAVGVQFKTLRETVHSELNTRRFAWVTEEKGKVHDRWRHEWAIVLEKFTATAKDIEAALDCYALEQHTACVFHMMRVAELGLRSLASTVRAKIIHKGKPCLVEFADWGTVVTAVRNKIASARKLSGGPVRQKRLDFYSNAADHCEYIKDIWRNDVSHARRAYSDAEALGVVNRVRDFMALLAKGLDQ